MRNQLVERVPWQTEQAKTRFRPLALYIFEDHLWQAVDLRVQEAELPGTQHWQSCVPHSTWLRSRSVWWRHNIIHPPALSIVLLQVAASWNQNSALSPTINRPAAPQQTRCTDFNPPVVRRTLLYKMIFRIIMKKTYPESFWHAEVCAGGVSNAGPGFLFLFEWKIHIQARKGNMTWVGMLRRRRETAPQYSAVFTLRRHL